nr:mobile element protein [Streptococcus thermophilus]
MGARVQQSPLLSLEEKNRHSFYSWKMDETYINIKGRWHYLYRAIDADGLTLDI